MLTKTLSDSAGLFLTVLLESLKQIIEYRYSKTRQRKGNTMSSDYHYQNIQATYDGVPYDKWNHALDRQDKQNNDTEARDLTSPYGCLSYGMGSGDDFYCFDVAVVHFNSGDKIALHSVINSETGGFIQDGEYKIVPPDQALAVAQGMVDEAHDWMFNNGVRQYGWGKNNGEAFIKAVKRIVRSLKQAA
jgi:hypothetical protein